MVKSCGLVELLEISCTSTSQNEQGKEGLQNEYQDALCYAKCPLNLNDLFIP